MGCANEKQQTVIVVYSSTGWAQLAHDVCKQLLLNQNNITIDCRAAGSVTDQLQIFLVRNNKQVLVFSGDMKKTKSQLKQLQNMLKKKMNQ